MANHSFDPQLAKEYGLEEAVMIHGFQWWIGTNRANERNQADGRTWSYNSYQALAEMFPYWTASQTRRVVEALVRKGVLLKGQRSLKGGDARNWYAFADEARFLDPSAGSDRPPSVKSDRCLSEMTDHLPESAD